MAAVESIMAGARTYMRDHPRFFTATVAKSGLTATFNMPHRNILTYGMAVAGSNSSVNATGVHEAAGLAASATQFLYVVDEREGLVRIVTPITGGFSGEWSFNFEGYRYQWVNDVDLRYFANNIVAEHAYHRADFDMATTVSDVEEDCMALGAACEAFWSLLAEYSRDIDINTPEGISVPTTQRFRQLEGMLLGNNGLLEKYKAKANMLGVGLDRIEMMTLRRVSRTTNRLVPVYRPREWDDASPATRVFPPIDQIAPSSPPPSFSPAGTVQGFYDAGGGAIPNP